MKIVFVSPMLPNPKPDNAGERYLLQLYRALGTAETLVIAPRTPRSIEAVQPGAAAHLLIPYDDGPPILPLRRLRAAWGHAFSVSPHAGFARALRRHPEACRALAEADIVDVQWESSQLLLPLLRRLAPNARIVLTFHDVASQQKSRELAAARGLRSRIKAAAGLAQARWLERRAHEWADELVVLSEKDRSILPRPDRATVIYPPIAADIVPPAPADTAPGDHDPRVLFIGPLWREPNREAVQWLVDAVWPIVRRAVPNAQLHVAGSLPESIAPLVPRAPGVTYAGFVDDLDGLYASSAVLAAPLQQGAGVKFKVLEAIARGVPTALTSIAAEGIGDAAFMPRSADSAEDFAQQLIEALRDPHAARAGATRGAQWASWRYGWPQFERRVTAVYGPSTAEHDPLIAAEDGPVPPITVVIPTRNGASMLSDELDAIAAEPEARDLEVIVSDNGSRDRTVAVARAYSDAFGSLRVVDSSAVAGVGHARNVGARAARADRVVFIDADDQIRPGFIGAIRAALDRADAAGGLPLTGRLGPADPTAADATQTLRRAPFGTLRYGMGCALGVRTEVLFGLGGFDESFREGHEEVDFSWRLQLAGHTLVGEPGAVLDYRQRPTPRSSFRQYRRYARSAEQLRSRYVHSLQLPPASVRGAARAFVRAVAFAARDARRKGTIDVARRLGWAYGALEGTIRYRRRPQPVDAPPSLVVASGAATDAAKPSPAP
ncbi:glycosyltransferase [Cryobacterium sp. 1639]|uniref:glycosyltransferase n=1 Tax=Cryobacterium inferilacus TaxID=2866629 RepID=UPI001C72F793|nr:glycosyltransferase [Cryobacterium sp. 1639]MBX0301331.1 glycosyltransferase [Cryobacterium sp. 1639]